MSVKMDEKRKGEIAYAALKVIVKRRPINFLSETLEDDKEWEKISEETGVLANELREFSLILFKEVTEEAYNEIKKRFQAKS